jgi:transcriptional regulator with PAS, ATPase and Fis domain
LKDLAQSERILAEFFKNSDVGLAVFDQNICYQMVNPYLAASNCTSIESHLGKHVKEILGKVGLQVEAAVQQVFANSQPLLNCELVGVLPTKPRGGHWIDTFFPIADSNGKVKQVGAVVVELESGIQIQTVHNHPSCANGVLRSWKDIAQYLGACVKTVQRWEHLDGFPVHRIIPKKGAVVFALRDEVDTWLRTRSCRGCCSEKRLDTE